MYDFSASNPYISAYNDYTELVVTVIQFVIYPEEMGLIFINEKNNCQNK